jgi:hypothetical protein
LLLLFRGNLNAIFSFHSWKKEVDAMQLEYGAQTGKETKG